MRNRGYWKEEFYSFLPPNTETKQLSRILRDQASRKIMFSEGGHDVVETAVIILRTLMWRKRIRKGYSSCNCCGCLLGTSLYEKTSKTAGCSRGCGRCSGRQDCSDNNLTAYSPKRWGSEVPKEF